MREHWPIAGFPQTVNLEVVLNAAAEKVRTTRAACTGSSVAGTSFDGGSVKTCSAAGGLKRRPTGRRTRRGWSNSVRLNPIMERGRRRDSVVHGSKVDSHVPCFSVDRLRRLHGRGSRLGSGCGSARTVPAKAAGFAGRFAVTVLAD